MPRTRILVMCHANRWRSPLAAAFLSRDNPHLDVRQAGFLPSGRPAGKPVRATAKGLGFDLDDHRSTQINQELVDWADIVVVMNPKQLDKVVKKFTVELSPARARLPSVTLLGSYLRVPVASIPDLAFINPTSVEWERVVSMIGVASRSLAECLKPKEPSIPSKR